MTRIHLRPDRPPRQKRSPVDLAARVTERARLMRAQVRVDVTDLGDPPPGRSALDERIAELERTTPWAPSSRLTATRNPWAFTSRNKSRTAED